MQASTANILVVDDEVGMREGCRRALSLHGYQVTTAEHAIEGLQKLREGQFDLILLDAMMPGMSGLEFLEHIHQHDPDIVCIMITGYATVDLATQATKQGAREFLPKPFTSDELLQVVRSGLEVGQRLKAVRRQVQVEEEALQLERARQEIAKLDAMQSRFMLVIAHELRNPAGVLKNYLQLMKAGYVDDDDWDEYIDKLDLRATQLLQMLDDILELAQLKEKLNLSNLKSVALAEVLQEVIQRYQPAAQEKGLGLDAEILGSPRLLAQRAHLVSLWSNLVANALQYTPRGWIRVTLSEKNGVITSLVTDTGIGISTEEIARIFQEFYRSESARALVPLGTGLGLAIVDQIVKTYHGSIQVDSAPGQGSTFTVRLPLDGAGKGPNRDGRVQSEEIPWNAH